MKQSRLFLFLLILFPCLCTSAEEGAMSYPWNGDVQKVLELTEPLKFSRGSRLPIYSNPTQGPGTLDAEAAERLVRELDSRGIAVVSSWNPNEREASLATALTLARAQQKLGLTVNTCAASCTYFLFNGEESTAHVDENGKPFFDESIHPTKKDMGCPFALEERLPVIRERVDYFARAYEEAGVEIGFVWTDWEVDGPIDVNRAHDYSRRCARCRAHIPDVDDFNSFQKAIREMRSWVQYYIFTEPLLSRFPDALVGNYAVYPNDGYRYWLDYFENDDYVDGQPFVADQGAKYRTWYQDYPGTGFSMAMPVAYTWPSIYDWYDFENSDYHWFYNMLLTGSNAGKSTPADVPVVTFVSYDPEGKAKDPENLSKENYQELIWHLLFRKNDTFFVWAGPQATADTQEVYAAAQEYGEFLDRGMPISYEVPARPGTVISGLVLRDEVLVRRTDFDGSSEPVEVRAGTQMVTVEATPGRCQVISLR